MKNEYSMEFMESQQTTIPVWAVLLVAGLVLVLYAPVLRGLVWDWWQDPNYSHGFLVPVFSAYVVWRERERYCKRRLAPGNFGLPVMVAAVMLLVAGSLGAELFTSRSSLIVLLAGMVLFLGGWEWLRSLAFPLGYLVLMIPIPVLIQNQVVFPLQLLASRLAAALLEALGMVVLREGNVLYLGNSVLEVADACSGIRSLVSLIALAIAYGYLAEKRRWMRAALALLMAPIAVVSNAVRVVGTGVLAYKAGQEWTDGFFHTFSGLMIFMVALGLMLAVHRVLLLPARGRLHAQG